MKPTVSMERSPSPSVQRRAEPPPLRVLVVAGEGGGGLLQSLRQGGGDAGLEIEAALGRRARGPGRTGRRRCDLVGGGAARRRGQPAAPGGGPPAVHGPGAAGGEARRAGPAAAAGPPRGLPARAAARALGDYGSRGATPGGGAPCRRA